ncbi:MAG TPA: LemA family protein [Acidobacteriota bacterium]|nr:LemA family protein [Acidobacteriota bacterium]
MLFASVLLLAVGIAIVGIYNSLVRLKVLTENAWSDIGVQLKRRHDLIPNLVNTVEGYASHEKQTLQAVVDARTQALLANGPAQSAQMEGQLTQALKSIFALAESYPQLRASENFAELQSSLNQIEAAIQNARRYYNAVVRDLNTKVAQFPSNIVAGFFKFEKQDFFELDQGEEAVPEVKFSS